ncbi:hypothetical protein [Clostridium botulinum]|uniref:hypothetical protein n=1 Tax=Clostridium botulinum TaxID=1491 RepID=UPI000774BA05|nr:hypothetical protein [Clostridium botulinum]NFF79730.1 hypothetical protein [Clostridium botulinum]
MYYNMGINKKPSESKSEDLVGYNNGFFWLLDGATPPAEKTNKELTQIYINLLNAALTNCALECKNTNLLLERSIEKVRNSFEKNYDLSSIDYFPYSTAVIFKIDDKAVEYTVLGDSYLSIATENSIVNITDDRLKRIAVKERRVVQEMRENGIDEKSIEYKQARKNLIYTELDFQNIDGGYWVAGLNPIAARESVSGKITIGKDKQFFVFAASDGLARLITHFDKFKDFKSLGKEIEQNGAKKTFEMLRKLESNKSNFKKPVSSKHDDASFVMVCNN